MHQIVKCVKLSSHEINRPIVVPTFCPQFNLEEFHHRIATSQEITVTNIVTASNTVLEFLGVAGVWRFTSLSNSHLTPTSPYNPHVNPPFPSTPSQRTLCIGCLTPTAFGTIWTLLKWNTCTDPDRPNFPGWPLSWLQAAVKIGINWIEIRFIRTFGSIYHIFFSILIGYITPLPPEVVLCSQS